MKLEEYDYIVVGSGSAGCTVAARLAEDGHASVLVVEAGGSDRNPLISIPLAWGLVFRHRLFDWDYWTEPEQALNGRRIECARGRVIGGSSSVNGMVYARGIAQDYDGWRERWGLEGWDFNGVLPYFQKSESWPKAGHGGRGNHGPLHLTELHPADPLVPSFLEAVREAGFGRTDDYNGSDAVGFGAIQATIYQGRRWSTAAAYLRPALGRPNLRLRTRALVMRVVIERGRAVGVECIVRGKRQLLRARKEVILSAGVFNSPQLLMLSGVGPADELERHSIPVHAALSGVGQNLHDHLALEVRWERRDESPLRRALRIDRAARAVLQAHFFGNGIASTMPLGAIGLVRSRPELEHPDAQMLLGTAPLTAKPYLNPFVRPYVNAFTVKGMLVKPESRGRVRLRSADPTQAPMIEQRLLSAAPDLRSSRVLLEMIRALGSQPALQRHIARELAPGPSVISDDSMEAYLRSTVSTLHHPVGTCRMGSEGDEGAVLDARMRVRGIDGLRVIDASGMPEITRGPINGPVIMMAEKAAADILSG